MRNSSNEVSAELYGSGVICHGGYCAGRSHPGVAASCKHVEDCRVSEPCESFAASQLPVKHFPLESSYCWRNFHKRRYATKA